MVSACNSSGFRNEFARWVRPPKDAAPISGVAAAGCPSSSGPLVPKTLATSTTGGVGLHIFQEHCLSHISKTVGHSISEGLITPSAAGPHSREEGWLGGSGCVVLVQLPC